MRFSTLLAATAMLGIGMTANAHEWLLSPDPDEVQTVESIISVKTVWNVADVGYEYNTAYFFDSDWNQIDVDITYDWDDWNVLHLKPVQAITTPGEYTLAILPNISETIPNETIEVKYVVTGVQGGGVISPVLVSPTPDTTVVESNETPFSPIRLEFEKAVWLDQSGFSLTGPDGEVDFWIGGFSNPDNPMFQYNTGNPFVTINFNDGLESTLPSGHYTLDIAAGAISTAPNGAGDLNEVLSYSWDYENNAVEGDDTPLIFNNIFRGKNKVVGRDANYNPIYAVDYDYDQEIIFDGCEMADWVEYQDAENPGDVFIFDLNHGEKAGYAFYELYDPSKQEIIRQGGLVKNEYDQWLLNVPRSLKFYQGVNYQLTVRTYNQEARPNVEYGDGATLTFTGTNKPYEFSPIEFVATSPDSETYVIMKESQNTFAVIYNGNVKIDETRTSVNTGFGTSAPLEKIESRNGQEYDGVWYLTIPTTLLDDTSVIIAVYAADEQGRQVKGNTEGATPADYYQTVSYKLGVTQPRIKITDGNTHKGSLKTFRITGITQEGNEKGINTSWLAYPELRDKSGKKVCGIDQEYAENEVWGTILLEPYKILRTTGGSEPEPLELEFALEQEITEPGQYTLYFPAEAFNFGTQFDGENSVEQEFTYWVVPHYDVTYVHDNHSFALAPVEEGLSATFNVSPAEGWKLSKLLFNDEDVTENVVDNMYTTPAVLSHSTLAAEYAFDGVTVEPVGMNDVVTDLNLRAWSQEGQIYVAGLKADQVVNLYTTGGAFMQTITVGDYDTVRFTAPEGVYVITVTEGATRVAIKVVNK